MQKLWTRDFAIITFSTFVSTLGNVMAGFAMSLLVLDRTGSTFLFALFMVLGNAPRIIMPALAGPILDRHSRRNVIVALDYLCAALYFAIFSMVAAGRVNLVVFMALNVSVGTIDSVYSVAYDSLYPTLIAKENFRSAYAVASMLYPMAALVAPLSSLLYGMFGIAPILLFNALTFVLCAFAESFIDEDRSRALARKGRRTSYMDDLREGFAAIAADRGLAVMLIYLGLNIFCDSTQNTLVLPYFQRTPGLSETMYTFLSIASVLGRIIGGAMAYRTRMKAKYKFALAILFYIFSCSMDGVLLFAPYALMLLIQFVTGVTGVTSFNIRVTGLQSALPDARRARVNGVFSMVFAIGAITGQLASGSLSEILPIRQVVVMFSSLNLLLILFLLIPNGRYVGRIYNID